jgi:hypothetical protein
MLACGGGTDTPTPSPAKGSGGSTGNTTSGASGTDSTGTAGAVTSGAGGAGQGGSDTSACSSTGLPAVPMTSDVVSDFEGDAGLGVQSVMAGGNWTMDTDMTGMVDMKIDACGTTGNGLHFTGSGHTAWGADASATFIGANAPVDASQYTGVSFTIKAAKAVPVIVKLQNPDSEPSFCQCGATPAAQTANCYAGYVKTINASTEATPTSLTWNQITKATWGYHAPGQTSVDPKNLIGLAFAVDKGIDFDLCIDDVKFTK